MRYTALFTASLALLSFLSRIAAEPSLVTKAVDTVTADKVDGFEDAVDTSAAISPIEARAHDDDANSAALVARQAVPGPYNIPCRLFPNVCENWCYYVFCHKHGAGSNSAFWTVTVNRTAGLRPQSECGRLSPNKCSVLSRNPWPPNRAADQDCDEQPKNTNNEGGANAATRCMPRAENRGEGSAWSAYINKPAPNRVDDGTKVKVTLEAPPPLGVCASYRVPNTSVCLPPARPDEMNVDQDEVRQQ
ncbi:hypothetical protein PsYK624_156050 [Phanerochaete sordida]|uniref:Deoxyribonuclease NucA/NucB domain-containing protein n=1 Tax=Phanerochaete sordida TaxID=48140 RepID=A0A9P3GQK8_9APHY|nr:hypothetical protein PsYK624_156050 [Phanerochaete sordida]